MVSRYSRKILSYMNRLRLRNFLYTTVNLIQLQVDGN